MEENRRFSWADLFIKVILVIIFVLFAVWLLSLSNKGLSNSLNVLTDDIFAKNIERMKEVGKEYFTTERLPQKIGEIETLTLEEMYEKKLILEVKDKYGNACDAEDSYVSIEKFENEYQMKVNLECGEEEDYIIVIMGCYDYCDTDICEKREETVAEIEYEYKKTTGGKWTDYGKWSEWSKVSVTSTNYRQVETKKVNEEYTYDKTITDTLYDTVKAECPDGYMITSDGTKCYKNTTVYSYDTPTCPAKSGFTVTRNGFTCTYKKTETADPTCPAKSGFTVTRDGFTCTYKKTETDNPTCPAKSGFTVTRNGFTCTYTKTTTSTTEYDRKYSHTATGSYVPVDTATYDYEEIDADYIYDCNTSCAMKWVYTYKVYKKVYKTITVTETGTAQCPSGYSQSGSTCAKPITETGTATCPSGYSQSGSTCAKPITETGTATCPTGFSKSGNRCAKPATNTDYEDVIKVCSAEYKLTSDGSKCYRNVTSTVKEIGTREVTYYRYRIREYVGGTTDYKWSKSKNDKDLLNAGYVLTGRTR